MTLIMELYDKQSQQKFQEASSPTQSESADAKPFSDFLLDTKRVRKEEHVKQTMHMHHSRRISHLHGKVVFSFRP